MTTIHIPLSNGGTTAVDAADAARVRKHVWHRDTGGYARAMIKTDRGWRLVRLHRFLLGGDLRPCSPAQNMGNVAKQPGTTSRFKGVSWHKAGQKWLAQIRVNGKRRYLGSFASEEEAGSAYAEAARGARGEFAEIGAAA